MNRRLLPPPRALWGCKSLIHISQKSVQARGTGGAWEHTHNSKCHQREQRRGQDYSGLDLASRATLQQLAHGDSLLLLPALLYYAEARRKAANSGQTSVIKSRRA